MTDNNDGPIYSSILSKPVICTGVWRGIDAPFGGFWVPHFSPASNNCPEGQLQLCEHWNASPPRPTRAVAYMNEEVAATCPAYCAQI